MRVGRSVLFGAAIFAAGTPASFVATTILLDVAPETVVWAAINYPASFLRLPLTFFMLAGVVFAVLTILRVRSGDRNAIRTAPDAAMYFHAVTVVYVSIALSTPYFDIWSYEPALYAPFAIALLAMALSARNAGQRAEGDGSESRAATDSQQSRAIALASLAAAMAIGASVAYGLQLLNGDTADCTRAWCSTEATIAFMGVMAVGAIVVSAMMLRGVFGGDSAMRQGHLSVTMFACLTLFIAPLVVFRVVPYYAFVPGLLYGLSATALLISISPKSEATETSEPAGELPPPPDMPI
ncbi:MAG: hypothetical protein F4X20_06580 [Dehalococcoidia bacterium]|nr:hypothetical protein [Dehalococcoidia bacterium]